MRGKEGEGERGRVRGREEGGGGEGEREGGGGEEGMSGCVRVGMCEKVGERVC